MSNSNNTSKQVSHFRRLATILICLTAGGFCLFKASDGRLFNKQATASSTTEHADLKYKMKSVADFKAGDTILAFNHETGEFEKSRVVQTFNRTSDHLRILTFLNKAGEEQRIKTTNEHPFWSVDQQDYITAEELKTGELFRSPNGSILQLTTSEYEPHPKGIAVYNLEAETHHNYFVKATGSRAPPVLAHNANCNLHANSLRRGATQLTTRELGNLRRTAVRQAWKQEQALLKRTGEGTRKWTAAQMKELLKTGKIKGFQGHHINSVNGHPHLAGNPNNIEFVTRPENLLRHGGNFQNPTSGPLINRGISQ